MSHLFRHFCHLSLFTFKQIIPTDIVVHDATNIKVKSQGIAITRWKYTFSFIL